MLKIQSITKYYEDRCLLDAVSFEIQAGERLGLIGDNGCGKTTLMKCVTGELLYEEGAVKHSGIMGYLPQSLSFGTANTPYSLMEQYLEHPSYSRVLGMLQVAELLWQPVELLSGGEKTRCLLAALLLMEPDVLLLDEPTNHLDLEGLEFLKEYLLSYKGAVLMVSHDRHFLNETATRIIELHKAEVKSYKGNYDAFKKQRNLEISLQAMSYEKYMKKKESLELAANQHMKRAYQFNDMSQNDFQRGRSKKIAKRGQSINRRIERLEKVEKPEWIRPIPLYMNAVETPMKTLIRAEDLTLKFETHQCFEGVDFQIDRGQCIALTGKNGSGKSSLLKGVLNETFFNEHFEGHLKKHDKLTIGYFSQELTDLCPTETLLEAVESIGLPLKELRNFLGAMNFKEDDVFKKIQQLSYGEKARIAFFKLVLGHYTLLLLDEPTNFLDLSTRETIEMLLNQYEGSILFVSHDRYFVEAMAEELWELSPNGLIRRSVDYRQQASY